MPQVAAVEPAEKDARCGAQAGRNHILAVRPARRAMECRRGTVAIAATEDGNQRGRDTAAGRDHPADVECPRSEEHTSELQSLMRLSYAVFCLKKKKTTPT